MKDYPEKHHSGVMVLLVIVIVVGFGALLTSDVREFPSVPGSPGQLAGNIGGLAFHVGDVIPGGYAPPWDIFNDDEMISVATPEVIAFDSGNLVQNSLLSVSHEQALIYKYGFVYDLDFSVWVPFTFYQETMDGSDWIADYAEFAGVLENNEVSDGEYFFVTYSCKQYNGEWKCGCASEDDCGYWMIQSYDVSNYVCDDGVYSCDDNSLYLCDGNEDVLVEDCGVYYTCDVDAGACVIPSAPSFCGDGTCDAGEYTSNCPEDCSCTDSDGGINYYVQGETTLHTPQEDFCDSVYEDRLNEYYCNSAGGISVEYYICPNGCEDGACLPEEEPVNEPETLLWLGQENGHLRSCDVNDECIDHGDISPGTVIFSLAVLEDKLWLGQAYSLSSCDGDLNCDSIIMEDHILSSAVFDDKLWVGGKWSGDLWSCDSNSNCSNHGDKGGYIYSMAVYDNKLWIGHASGHLSSCDSSGSCEDHGFQGNYSADSQASGIYSMAVFDNKLWLGQNDGTLASCTIDAICSYKNRIVAINDPKINTMKVYEDYLWVGLSHGYISKCNEGGFCMNFLPQDEMVEGAGANDMAAFNNLLYVGMNDGDLFSCNVDGVCEDLGNEGVPINSLAVFSNDDSDTGGGAGPACGDGVCDAGEDASSCSEDCVVQVDVSTNMCGAGDKGLKCEERAARNYCIAIGYSDYMSDSKVCDGGDHYSGNWADNPDNPLQEYCGDSGSDEWVVTIDCIV
ncbi:hypothetical protein HQ533_03570 [Candidatus Woesearchaeota archaeon]|nr:hypothetical protein [Candidatus Woesearchaeota archaeon]